MTQSQHKKKSEVQKKKKGGVLQVPAEKSEAVDQDALARAELWKSEIESLMGQTFPNTGEALHCLIDKVLTRLGIEGKEKQETQDHLMLLLDTDEEIKEELERVIKVGR